MFDFDCYRNDNHNIDDNVNYHCMVAGDDDHEVDDEDGDNDVDIIFHIVALIANFVFMTDNHHIYNLESNQTHVIYYCTNKDNDVEVCDEGDYDDNNDDEDYYKCGPVNIEILFRYVFI